MASGSNSDGERVTTGSEPRRRWPEGFAPFSPLTNAEVAEAVDAARAEMLNEVYMTAEDSATVYGELSRQLQDELEVVERGHDERPATRTCACCGENVTRPDGDPWEGRLDAYCLGCATARCDAFPGECGRPATREPDEEREAWICPVCPNITDVLGAKATCAGSVFAGTEHEPARMRRVVARFNLNGTE